MKREEALGLIEVDCIITCRWFAMGAASEQGLVCLKVTLRISRLQAMSVDEHCKCQCLLLMSTQATEQTESILHIVLETSLVWGQCMSMWLIIALAHQYFELPNIYVCLISI